MSIEINGLPPVRVVESTDDSSVKQALKQQTEHKSTGSSAADTVSISDSAARIANIDNSTVTTPVVDAQRVEQLKQAISDGSFKVDSAKIADKLMQFESILKPEG